MSYFGGIKSAEFFILWVTQPLPIPPYKKNLQILFDIRIVNNISLILTEGIVKKYQEIIFSQVKNGGRGVESTPPRPEQG